MLAAPISVAICGLKLCLYVIEWQDLALQALVEGHMLTSDEEASLRECLRFREEDRWLHLLYRCVTFRASSLHTKLVTFDHVCDCLFHSCT